MRPLQLARRALALAGLIVPAAAQTSTWTPGLAAPGTPFPTSLSAVYDDGAGELLYVAGTTDLGPSVPRIARVARWNGRVWEEIFSIVGQVANMTAFVSGTVGVTSSLFAARETYSGSFQYRIERWDGLGWTTIGTPDGRVSYMAVLDDGGGALLYAVGLFTSINGVTLPRIGRWDGTTWTPISSGGLLASSILELGMFDHGAGAGVQLHAAESATTTPSAVSVWDGVSWSPLGAMPGAGYALATYPVGGVPRLFCGSNMATGYLSGATWVGFAGGGLQSYDLLAANLGGGPLLYFIGPFVLAGGVTCNGIASFDGTNVAALGSGFGSITGLGFPRPTLALVHEAGVAKLYATGGFTQAGGQRTSGLAAWNGTDWSILGRGLNARVLSLASCDIGAGETLYAVGPFTVAGGAPNIVRSIGQWNGSTWSRPPGGPPDQFFQCVASANVGNGRRLYVAGIFDGLPYNGITAWNGTSWTTLGGGTRGETYAMLEHDDGAGARLFVGGNFPIGAPSPGNRIAAWNGSAWSSLGGGMNNIVGALARYDEGAGSMLFAGGSFTTAGGSSALRIARWNGSAWSTVGTGISNGGVNALCSFGGQLYVGGTFTNAGGVPVSYLARWNGTSWSDVPGGGANGAVLALHVHDDGRGPALYVGGGFAGIGGITAYNVARFDGASWEPVDIGTDGVVRTITSVDDDGDGDRELFLGGDFLRAGNDASGYFARLEGRPRYERFCFGDGTVLDHTTPCPCANDGAPGHGCANAFDPAGGLLTASGGTNPDTIVLSGSGMPPTSPGIYLQHDGVGEFIFHDGVLCAGGTLIRLRNRTAAGGASSFPDSSDTQTLSQRGQVTPGSGALRYYSLFYRSASPTFCPPATANVTNGVRVLW